MMELKQVDLLALQSGYMKRDPFTAALCEALKPFLRQSSADIETVLLYTRIDSLPEEVLDQLAMDRHLEGYDKSDSLESRRKLVRSSFRIHKYKGTVYAVKTALDSLFQNARLEEWFAYGGSPYCFLVRISALEQPITLDSMKRILLLVEETKNVRSHLDRLIIELHTDTQVYVGSSYKFGHRVTIQPPGSVWLGMAYWAAHRVKIEGEEECIHG